MVIFSVMYLTFMIKQKIPGLSHSYYDKHLTILQISPNKMTTFSLPKQSGEMLLCKKQQVLK